MSESVEEGSFSEVVFYQDLLATAKGIAGKGKVSEEAALGTLMRLHQSEKRRVIGTPELDFTSPATTTASPTAQG